jgi:short-subunit dehydrogenase
LITGASEGIGKELARIMAGDGWDLVITARRRELLDERANELRTQHNRRIEVIQADLTQPEGAQVIHEEIVQRGITIDALVNNAGVGYFGRFCEQDLNRVTDMIRLNMESLVRLTHIFANDMIRRGGGRIMNVASVVAFMPLPYNNIYGATKAFVLSFSEALAKELEGTGVIVTAFCPGSTESGFHRSAGGRDNVAAFGKQMTAKKAALIGYRAMMKGKRLEVAGLKNKLLTFALRLLSRRTTGNISAKIIKVHLGNKDG